MEAAPQQQGDTFEFKLDALTVFSLYSQYPSCQQWRK